MAFLGQEFNEQDFESGQYELIPTGWYEAAISEAELKDTKSGTGQYIKIRYDITGPTNEGRCVFGNINIRNANPKAEAIGHQELGDIMRAIGLSKVQDTDQLIGGQLKIKVTYREADGQYDAQNEVRGFKAIDGSRLPTGRSDSAPPPSENDGGAKPPWAK